MAESPAPHHCYNCGFLGLRAKTGELVEADGSYRVLQAWEPSLFDLLPIPVCAAMRANFFLQTLGRLLSQSDSSDPMPTSYARARAPLPEDVQVHLFRARACFRTEKEYGWTQHQPGFTPKEHREMLDRQWMLEREDRRDADQRDWQERVQASVEKRADKRHTKELWIIGGVVTAVVVVATILAAVIEVVWGGDTINIPQPQAIVIPAEITQPILDTPTVQPSEAPEERPGR